MTDPTPLDPLASPLDCDAVDGLLASFLEESPDTSSAGGAVADDASALDPVTRAAVRAHVARCARCGPLVADLRALSAHAAALPVLTPSRDLWAGIADRLAERPAETPLVTTPIAAPAHLALVGGAASSRARRAAQQRPPLAFTHRRLAAAAVLLVAVSSGATYLATRPAAPPPRVAAAPAAQAPNAQAPNETSHAAPNGAPNASPAAPAPAGRESLGTLAAAEPSAAERRADRSARDAGAESGARLASRPASPDVDADVPGAEEYDREIRVLRAAVRERRGELDPVTVAVLRRNLRIIDAAIAASRAALTRDPHSPFLGDQLTRTLGQKVELLRTVALLPRS